VVALTDGNAKLAAYYEYDAWGNVMTEAEKTGVENPYRYSTKEWDEKSGFYYFGFRYYSPEIGRWTQRDPAGIVDALNLYLYVQNDPGATLDWCGLWWFGRHKRLTREMAECAVARTRRGQYARFPAGASKRIGWAAGQPDFRPFSSKESGYHLDLPRTREDDRRLKAEANLDAAVQAAKVGQCDEAYILLGMGAHALQDICAHDLPPRDDKWRDDFGSREMAAQRETLSYLRRFLKLAECTPCVKLLEHP